MIPDEFELNPILQGLSFLDAIDSVRVLTTGFSGARLFQIDADNGSWCLRGWPEHVECSRLDWIGKHLSRARELGCDFLPVPFGKGRPFFFRNQIWTLQSWLAGEASLNSSFSINKLENAVRSINQLHRTWESMTVRRAPSPIASQRLKLLQDVTSRLLRMPAHIDRPSQPLPILAFMDRAFSSIPQLLATGRELAHREYDLQPIVGDLWHDHLLFDQDQLVGIIDFDALKIDSIWCDWGRMIASLRSSSSIPWTPAIDLIASIRPVSCESEGLARWLAHTGLLLATVNWLEWLFVERRSFENLHAARARFSFVMEQFVRFEDR